MADTRNPGNTTTGVDAGLGTDIASILALINGLSSNSGAMNIAQGADPWGPQRGQYQTELNSFMADPSSVLKDPAFLAAENLGAENVARNAGAAGMGNSGNNLAALFNYGQTAGLNFEQQKFNQLSSLAGVNAGSPAAAAQLQEGVLANQGTNLATGISGIAGMLPGILSLLGLGGGSTGGLSGLPGFLKSIFGGSGGGSINQDGSINWGSTGTGPGDAGGGPGSSTDPFAGIDGGFDWNSILNDITGGSGVDTGGLGGLFTGT